SPVPRDLLPVRKTAKKPKLVGVTLRAALSSQPNNEGGSEIRPYKLSQTVEVARARIRNHLVTYFNGKMTLLIANVRSRRLQPVCKTSFLRLPRTSRSQPAQE